VAPEISVGGNFMIDKKGQFYTTTTLYGYIKNTNISESYKCLLAILNSQLFWWYLVRTGTVLANGYFRYKPDYIKTFPVPIISLKEQAYLEKLVDKLCSVEKEKEKNEYENLNAKIDEVIFNIYDLTIPDRKEIFSV
jgi:hypothetical protein